MREARGDWYMILTAGGAMNPTPSPGPHRGEEAAVRAWDRFRHRYGWQAGTYLSATSARIVGPFRTRREAASADISRY